MAMLQQAAFSPETYWQVLTLFAAIKLRLQFFCLFSLPFKECSRDKKEVFLGVFSWQLLLIMKKKPWDSKQKGKYGNLMSCTPVQTLVLGGGYIHNCLGYCVSSCLAGMTGLRSVLKYHLQLPLLLIGAFWTNTAVSGYGNKYLVCQ